MKKLLLITLALAIAAPSFAQAEWSPVRRGVRRGGRTVAPVYRPEARRVLAPAPSRSAPSPAPRPTWGSRAYVVGADPNPFWLGWSWGWGYYPLYPNPYRGGPESGSYPADPQRLTARVEAYGAGASNAAAATLALSMEGPVAGFGADVTGLALSDPTGTASDGGLTLASARAAWSIASDASFRLRAELGGSMLSVPSSGMYSGTPYANTMAFGPQLGLSGNLGLVGPFGLEGFARVTPWPVPVVDARAALVVRGGSLALSAGWRSIDVNGNGVDAPEAHFHGPELGLQLMF